MQRVVYLGGDRGVAGCMTTAAFAADREIKVSERLDASADMMRAADNGIPRDLIDKAHCVVVLPGMNKAGFIFTNSAS